MELPVFLAVLLAAFLHATWNVVIRLNADRLLSLSLLQSLMGLIGIVMVAMLGLPAVASLPYAILSGLLHTGYNLFLVRAYRSADLSQVYPIARGAAPLLTLAATWILLNERLEPAALAGVVILVAGLLLTGIARQTPGASGAGIDPHAVYYALGTSVFIAVYTVVDGQGARLSANPFGYSGLIFALDALFLLLAGLFMRGPQLVLQMRPHWRSGLAGAAASGAAYAIVLWAMTKAPIAGVAALRETSIVFVLLLSARVLNESLAPRRIAGGLLIVAGAVLLRLG